MDLGPESGRELQATQEQGFTVGKMALGQKCLEEPETTWETAFLARDGGGSGSGERCVL